MTRLEEEIKKTNYVKIVNPDTQLLQPTFAEILKQKMPSKSIPCIILKPKNEQNNDKTRKELQSTIRPEKIAAGISYIKNARGGAILIKCETTKVKEIMFRAIETKMGNKYEENETKIRRPRIKIVNFQQDMNSDTIEECLKTQNNLVDKVTVKFIKKTKSGSGTIYCECSPSSFNTTMQQKKICIGWQRCSVYEDLELLRCYNCQEFFHKKNLCTNKIACSNCGGEHDETHCNVSTKCCRNCNDSNIKYKTKYDTGHSSSDFDCPTLIYHRNNLRAKTIYTD